MLNLSTAEVLALMEIKNKKFLKQEVVESVELSNFIPGVFLVYPDGQFPKMEAGTIRYLAENTDDATWNIIESVMPNSDVFYKIFIENIATNKKIATRASTASLLSVMIWMRHDDNIDPEIAIELFDKFFNEDYINNDEVGKPEMELIVGDVATTAVKFAKKHNLPVKKYLYHVNSINPFFLGILDDEELILLSKRLGFQDHTYIKDELKNRNLV